MRVLFIGGSGTISSACVAEANRRGHDVTVFNRQSAGSRPVPEGVHRLVGDLHDPAQLQQVLGNQEFDVVAEFMAFLPERVAQDIAFWEGRVGQYIYISSASAYRKPPTAWPITESAQLANPFWQYSRDKIAGEDLLVKAFRERGFPMTIIRPSHTYDERMCPTLASWTDVERLTTGQPVVVHGDGTSLWTITHNTDFAYVFTGLLGHPRAIGEAFHITGDEVMTWDAIYQALAAALGVEAKLVHIASDQIAAHYPDWGPGLLGDKAHSVVFDNSKVRSIQPPAPHPVPFTEGARQMAAYWHRCQESGLVKWDEPVAGGISLNREWNDRQDHLVASVG